MRTYLNKSLSLLLSRCAAGRSGRLLFKLQKEQQPPTASTETESAAQTGEEAASTSQLIDDFAGGLGYKME